MSLIKIMYLCIYTGLIIIDKFKIENIYIYFFISKMDSSNVVQPLSFINEVDLQITWVNWRTFERLITTTTFINHIMNYEQNKRYKKKSVFDLVYKNMRETDFVIAYYYIYTYGIQNYILLFGGEAHIILSNKILNDRNELYKSYVCRSF